MRGMEDSFEVEGTALPVRKVRVLILGSGAAALSCAVHLRRAGCSDLLVATDSLNGGTSLNTGSDKQTYYRLGDASPHPDSPYSMARSYLAGGSMHGDIALVEALGSPRAFYNLVSLGVPFPHNRFGGYTGYKTDHDPSSRGISLGPYTSRRMVEKLLEEARRLDVPVLDRHLAVRLLSSGDRAIGAVLMDRSVSNSDGFGLSVVLSDHVVLGTGGPAGLYDASVYPRVHTGSIGLAFEIGAEAANLGESQFGLASTKVRWNLSGSYQQVLPRYFSTDADGRDVRDFLSPSFGSWKTLTETIFLKGYQWPFNAANAARGGSSLIDLLVHREVHTRKRRVFLDFTRNPDGDPGWGAFRRGGVGDTALRYLDNSAAWADTPILRLTALNPAAVSLYRQNHIDLAREALEIGLCAQHNNGGLAADIWWESTSVRRLYPVGEVNGSHGVSRPGGSALNAGQVGALRAATRILGYGTRDSLDAEAALDAVRAQAGPLIADIRRWTGRAEATGLTPKAAAGRLDAELDELRKRMSSAAGPVRERGSAEAAYAEAERQESRWGIGLAVPRELLTRALRFRHMLIAQRWYLHAVRDYLERGGGSRGSYLVLDPECPPIHPALEGYRARPESEELRRFVQILHPGRGARPHASYQPCRPLPEDEFWFETVWAEYREGLFRDT